MKLSNKLVVQVFYALIFATIPCQVLAQALLDPDPPAQQAVRPSVQDVVPPETGNAPFEARNSGDQADQMEPNARPTSQPDHLVIPPTEQVDPNALYHRYNGSVADFKRIYLICNSNDPTHQLSANICAMFEAEARVAARRAGFKIEAGNVERDDGITLSVRINLAQNVQTAIAVYVDASRFYAKAIDLEASKTSPSAYPRKGRMVLYEKSFISFGRGDALEDSARERTRGLLRQFFRVLEK